MNTHPRVWVRVGLVGVLSLLGLAFTLSEAQSQFPRPPITSPPRPPITMPPPITSPRPPGFSGISGMPGGISGISGIGGGFSGISGMPGGISGISGGFSGISGMPGGISGFSGIGGFGSMTETVWTCSGCRAELGRGPIKPSYSSCPRCQAQFRNGIAGGGFTMTSPPPPMQFTPPPVTFTPPPATFTPPAQETPQFSLPGFTSPTTPTAGGGSGDTPSGNTGTKWKIVGLVAVALAVIAATGGALVWNANRSREVHRRRRYID